MGTPEVRLGGTGPVIPARLALRATRERIETAIVLRQQTVVIFEGGDRSRPLIVGFIEALEPQPSESRADVREPHGDTPSEGRFPDRDAAAHVTPTTRQRERPLSRRTSTAGACG